VAPVAALQRHALPFPKRLSAPKAIGRLRSGRLLLAGAVALVVGAALLQVNQFSQLTSTSYQIDQLNQQRAATQAENLQLEADVARLSSLARVDWEARVQLHMVPAERKLYLDVNHAVPERETLPTRFLPPEKPAAAAPAAATTDPLWKRLLKLLPFF